MFPGWQMVEALWVAKELGLNRFVCEQPAFHLLDRTAEREVIPAAPLVRDGRDPLGAAVRWPAHREVRARRQRRRSLEQRQGQLRSRGDPAGLGHDRPGEEAGGEKGCTPSQVALAWCAAQPGVTAPIIGPRTYEQVVDNLGAVDVELEAGDLERIDELVPPCGVAVRYYDRATRSTCVHT